MIFFLPCMIKNATKSKHSTRMKLKTLPAALDNVVIFTKIIKYLALCFYFWRKSCFTNCTHVRQDIETNTHAQTVISAETIGFVNIGMHYTSFQNQHPSQFILLTWYIFQLLHNHWP